MMHDQPEKRGSFLRFVIVSVVLLTIMCGTAYAILYALYSTRDPNYKGPEKLKAPEHAPFR